jgi:SAM-dependent methyltransferase
MSQYVFTNSWEKERERLEGLEAIWDPGTIRQLDALGLEHGWQCLEVGGGGGSIADWLCERVGPTGSVLATDVDTRFLRSIERPNLQVLEHDAREALPGDRAFDLIHARALVEHLGDGKQTAIKHMVDALRPGGWLFVEDIDFSFGIGTTVTGDGPLIKAVIEACLTIATSVGFEGDYGHRLPADLISAGLVDVGAEARSVLIRGRTRETIFFTHSMAVLRARAVERGLVSDEMVDEVLQAFEDPALRQMTPIVVAAWGRTGEC